MKLKGIVAAGILFLVVFSHFSALASEFTIGPGDVLDISVWRDESLSRTVTVPPDGIIAFPLIGDVDTNGMTVADLRAAISTRLEDYIQDVVVTVVLAEINSLNVYVIGKVNKPGAFSTIVETTVMQVLAMAGGLNPFASEKRIHILRKTPDGIQKIPFNYKEVLKGENLEQNIILQRGDVVVVP